MGIPLYEVPRNTPIKVVKHARVPPGSSPVLEDEIIFFHHLDGMFSYCHNSEGKVVHLLAWQEVEIVEPKNEKSSTNF